VRWTRQFRTSLSRGSIHRLVERGLMGLVPCLVGCASMRLRWETALFRLTKTESNNGRRIRSWGLSLFILTRKVQGISAPVMVTETGLFPEKSAVCAKVRSISFRPDEVRQRGGRLTGLNLNSRHVQLAESILSKVNHVKIFIILSSKPRASEGEGPG